MGRRRQRVQLSDSWLTDTPFGAANDRLKVFLAQKQMTVVKIEPALEVTQGSQLVTRLPGGWFVNPKQLPKRVEIRLSPAEGGAQVEVLIEETLGFGYLDGNMKARYESYFQSWLHELKGVLHPVQ